MQRTFLVIRPGYEGFLFIPKVNETRVEVTLGFYDALTFYAARRIAQVVAVCSRFDSGFVSSLSLNRILRDLSTASSEQHLA